MTSFKTIYENTYTVFIVEKSDNEYKILFRYIGYQPWESPVKGFLSPKTQDFIILNKDGTNFIRLDEKLLRRELKRGKVCDMMVHSLNSMNYLKVEDSNMLYFQQLTNENKMVVIQQCQTDEFGNHYFENIFSIKLQSMSLLDLIFI